MAFCERILMFNGQIYHLPHRRKASLVNGIKWDCVVTKKERKKARSKDTATIRCAKILRKKSELTLKKLFSAERVRKWG